MNIGKNTCYKHTHTSLCDSLLPTCHPAAWATLGSFPLYFMSFSSYRLSSVLNFCDVSFTFPSLHQAQQAGRLHKLAQYCRDSHSWTCLSLFMRLTVNPSLLLGDFKEWKKRTGPQILHYWSDDIIQRRRKKKIIPQKWMCHWRASGWFCEKSSMVRSVKNLTLIKWPLYARHSCKNFTCIDTFN